MSDDGVRVLATAIALPPTVAVASAPGGISREWLGGPPRDPGAGEWMQAVGHLASAVTEAIAPLAPIVASIIPFVGRGPRRRVGRGWCDRWPGARGVPRAGRWTARDSARGGHARDAAGVATRGVGAW